MMRRVVFKDHYLRKDESVPAGYAMVMLHPADYTPPSYKESRASNPPPPKKIVGEVSATFYVATFSPSIARAWNMPFEQIKAVYPEHVQRAQEISMEHARSNNMGDQAYEQLTEHYTRVLCVSQACWDTYCEEHGGPPPPFQ